MSEVQHWLHKSVLAHGFCSSLLLNYNGDLHEGVISDLLMDTICMCAACGTECVSLCLKAGYMQGT